MLRELLRLIIQHFLDPHIPVTEQHLYLVLTFHLSCTLCVAATYHNQQTCPSPTTGIDVYNTNPEPCDSSLPLVLWGGK